MHRGAWWATVHGVAKSQTPTMNVQKFCLIYSLTTLVWSVTFILAILVSVDWNSLVWS